LLTHLLLDTLKASTPARIINVASKHFGIKLNFDDLQQHKKLFLHESGWTNEAGLIMFFFFFTKRAGKKNWERNKVLAEIMQDAEGVP